VEGSGTGSVVVGGGVGSVDGGGGVVVSSGVTGVVGAVVSLLGGGVGVVGSAGMLVSGPLGSAVSVAVEAGVPRLAQKAGTPATLPAATTSGRISTAVSGAPPRVASVSQAAHRTTRARRSAVTGVDADGTRSPVADVPDSERSPTAVPAGGVVVDEGSVLGAADSGATGSEGAGAPITRCMTSWTGAGSPPV
jgi:hypothetical protein